MKAPLLLFIITLLSCFLPAGSTAQETESWPFKDGSRLESALGGLRLRLHGEGGFANLPKGVTLALEVDADPEAKGWYQVVLREFHSEDSGFDPNVAPALAHFYLRESDGKIEWYDLVEDVRRPFEDFLKDRKSQ